ncbi:MAG: hypothetical protein ABI635_02885 [Actinomycetota bacterium]
MRSRALCVIVTVAGLLAALPAGAARAGGNWLDIRPEDTVSGRWESWSGPFVPGTALEVRARLYAHGPQADRLRESGPYFAWMAPESGDRVDLPGIPSGAVRLSAFELHWTSPHFAVARTSFVVPALPSGRYTIDVCDDPCRLSGFGDFVQGWTSVVQSAEAASLQRQKERLQGILVQVRRDAAAARRDVERVQADLNDSQATRASLTARVAVLTDELASARRRTATTTVASARPLVAPWLGLLLAVAGLSLAAAMAGRRRAVRIVVPNTPEELLGRDELERPGVRR